MHAGYLYCLSYVLKNNIEIMLLDKFSHLMYFKSLIDI